MCGGGEPGAGVPQPASLAGGGWTLPALLPPLCLRFPPYIQADNISVCRSNNMEEISLSCNFSCLVSKFCYSGLTVVGLDAAALPC